MGGEQYAGFIYVILDKFMKQAYLGKKSYVSRAQGRYTESNWRSYMSSSKLVSTLVSNRPKEEFAFICLEQYRTKGTLSYSETWSLCELETPTSDKWLNKRLEGVTWKVKEPITQRHKERLSCVSRYLG